MHNSLQYSHQLIKTKVQPGDLVIDATTGNGYDTLLLAQLVGSKGQVLSYDIQATALEETRKRLEKENLMNQVQLIQRGHETVEQDLATDQYIKAAMFNLGYLPGGDHSIITHPNTTVKALETILTYLLPRGLVTIVTYYGHEGGEKELKQLIEFLTSLDQSHFTVLHYEFINQANQPPILFAVEKKSKSPIGVI